jgi:GMP synthase (glutamine-hydrolysing)
LVKETGKMDAILILDFGGQYCHLIGRRIREHGVYTDIIPHDISPEEVMTLEEDLNARGIILSGGPSSVYEKNAPRCDPKVFDLGIPILGLCYGHQLIAQMFGGRVEQSEKKEYGATHVTVDRAVGVLKGLKGKEWVWMSHGDTVYELPSEFEVLAHTENSPIAAFYDGKRSIYSLQWHPEVSHTKKGSLMLRNFIFSVCRCKANWVMGNFIERTVSELRRGVGNEKCIVALSGGVDSSTTAVLAARAVGKRLTAVFVDHGFMRRNEPESIRKTFAGFDMNLIVLDESERFLEKLRGVRDPERKRKIIGREFVRAFEKVARRIGAEYLVQGTIYPDRIESGYKKHSEKIKTHHNVAGLPTKIEFKAIIEPLKDLYKDEVRKVAELLGLPKEVVWRQPFPGPGLAARVVGEVTKEKLYIIKTVDKIVSEEIERIGLNEELWQYFPVLTETKSTGVKGDSRAYGYTVAIRAVESKDGMTAIFAKIPYKVLEGISTRVTNEIPQVNRVVYDISNKPPATIEWE